jgi:hypothetical protein
MASAGDAPGAQAAAATLAPFWDSTLRRRAPGVESNAAALFGRADAVADAATRRCCCTRSVSRTSLTPASTPSQRSPADTVVSGRQDCGGRGSVQVRATWSPRWRCPRCAPRPRQPGRARAATLASATWPPTARLRARIARPPRASGDWSIELPAGGCTCKLCDTLRVFAEDKSRRTFEWPIAQQSRQHVHSRIDAAELPVTHVTRRQGRPYTLVLNKTDALFAREQEARNRDRKDLEWLATQRNPNA